MGTPTVTIRMSTVAQENYGFPILTTIQNGIIEGNYDTKSGIQEYFGVPLGLSLSKCMDAYPAQYKRPARSQFLDT